MPRILAPRSSLLLKRSKFSLASPDRGVDQRDSPSRHARIGLRIQYVQLLIQHVQRLCGCPPYGHRGGRSSQARELERLREGSPSYFFNIRDHHVT
jgi:hypothetical protein